MCIGKSNQDASRNLKSKLRKFTNGNDKYSLRRRWKSPIVCTIRGCAPCTSGYYRLAPAPLYKAWSLPSWFFVVQETSEANEKFLDTAHSQPHSEAGLRFNEALVPLQESLRCIPGKRNFVDLRGTGKHWGMWQEVLAHVDEGNYYDQTGLMNEFLNAEFPRGGSLVVGNITDFPQDRARHFVSRMKAFIKAHSTDLHISGRVGTLKSWRKRINWE
jgi:hypothetical protein